MNQEYLNRIQWYTNARFGMFIHWGAYAVPARGEWVRSNEELSVEDYQPSVDAFHPDAYDPKAWAKAAKKAGMKYAVMTAKHHDGYCMFDTKTTDYSSMHYCHRDFIREYIEAFRNEGLKVGLYYSLIDWHHPDFPHYGDRHHPERNNVKWKDAVHHFDTYLDYMFEQVRELCTNYGTIDILWTDFSYDDMTTEKWRGTELVKMIRSLQPDIILNNRIEVSGEGFGSLLDEEPRITSGDFVSPEQIIPPAGIRNVRNEPVAWEACVTMNGSWGYTREDHWFKNSRMCIRKLVECVSKGGNLLLNVGPDEHGCIPEESLHILAEIGEWMDRNSASVYDCTFSGMNKPENGRITRNGKHLYYHIMDAPIGYIPLEGIKAEEIDHMTLLHDQRELKIAKTWITDNYPDVVFVSLGPDPLLPDETDTVIEVILK